MPKIPLNAMITNFTLSFDNYNEDNLLYLGNLMQNWFQTRVHIFYYEHKIEHNLSDELILLEQFVSNIKFNKYVLEPVQSQINPHDIIIMNDSTASIYLNLDWKSNVKTEIVKKFNLMYKNFIHVAKPTLSILNAYDKKHPLYNPNAYHKKMATLFNAYPVPNINNQPDIQILYEIIISEYLKLPNQSLLLKDFDNQFQSLKDTKRKK